MAYIYLDYAAATPLDPQVLAAMRPFLTKRFANPSSLHTPGREQRVELEAARQRVARTLGAKPADIIFTGGSTEAANLVIQGVTAAYPNGRVVASAIEHEAVLATLEALERRGYQTGLISVGESGVVDPPLAAAAITDLTVLVCVQYVNNEVGTIQPVAKVAAEVRRIRSERAARGVTTPLYLYCDAAQAGLQNLQVSRLGVDLMSMSASKLYGPAGSGFLYIRPETQLAPLEFGGGQENGVRPGTENVAAAVGLAAALERVQQGRAAESRRQAALRDQLWAGLRKRLPDLQLNGDTRQAAASFLSFVVPGANGEELVARLDAAGIGVATGSACAATSHDPSHVLLAVGRSRSQAAASLRLTLGRPTTKAEIQRVVQLLPEVVERARHHTASRMRSV